MEQALPAGDISKFTAEEYMAWVRYESEQCPSVVRADVNSDDFRGEQTPYMPKIAAIPDCPSSYLPEEDWENDTLESFSQLRLLLERFSTDLRSRERKLTVPPMKDETSWMKFCLGTEASAAESDTEDGDNHSEAGADDIAEKGQDIDDRKAVLLQEFTRDEQEEQEGTNASDNRPSPSQPAVDDGPVLYACGVSPSTRLMLQFDQVLTQRLLGYHAGWLQKSARIQEGGNLEQCATGWPEIAVQCQWIFCLLARLEKPLYQDTAATVRDIYRSLCVIRLALANSITSLGTGSAHVNDLADRQVDDALNLNRGGKGVRFVGLDSNDEEVYEAADGVDEKYIAIRDANCSDPVASAADNHLAVLNTIIVICGKYFGQAEESIDDPFIESNECNFEDGDEGDY